MKKYLTFIGMLLGVAACKDPYEVSAPVFNVSTEKNVYAVGERIRFEIEGSPDMINFYSGIVGYDYTYHDKDRVYEIIPSLNFRSAKYAGNNEDCADLLYTTDFNGDYTYENVKAANWISISNRFNIPPIVGTSASFSDSGTADIADLFEGGKNVYFAWRCKTNEASSRTQFQVSDFNINGESLDANNPSSVLYSQVKLDFRWVLNEAASLDATQPNVNTSRILWTGTFNNTTGPFKEGYAISGPVAISEQMNLGLDKHEVIKSIQNENVTEYFYTFDKAGEYEVVFVGYNVNFNGRKETVKRIKLTIE
ncbi:DUF5017 domain-containing protein [Pseudopedobacter beijingensis]|uniref:DUF5017 domain-containing protein n=1 Tax=Pseudopedobacter beijingensis TaxID=1207056 RepID=A0ABW4IH19_9SPHI